MDTPGEIARGYVEVRDGKIAEAGDMADCPAVPDSECLDLDGKMLLPGFVDAHSHIGLMEDSLGLEGDDTNEQSEPVTPHLRAIDGINPFDRCFAEARQAGVTTVVVSPGSANPIAGEICALKTAGRWVDRMVIRQPLAIKFSLGENPKMTYGEKAEIPMTRMATTALIREQLYKAKRYLENSDLAAADADRDAPEYDIQCEALLPLLRGEICAHFHAHKAYDLLTAIRIAEEFSLDYVLVHCTEGYQIADILAEKQARAICGPIICARTKPELVGQTLENVALLMQAGVTVAVSTDHPEVPVNFLTASAAMAGTAGLTWLQKLSTITISAARAVGLDDRIGSIAPGKDADLLVFHEDPFAVGAKPECVMIAGEMVQ